MLTARVTLEPAFGLGTVNRRLFGVSVEHMQHCVRTDIDERAYRTDVRRKATHPGAIGQFPGGDGQLRVALPPVSSLIPRLTPATKENQ